MECSLLLRGIIQHAETLCVMNLLLPGKISRSLIERKQIAPKRHGVGQTVSSCRLRSRSGFFSPRANYLTKKPIGAYHRAARKELFFVKSYGAACSSLSVARLVFPRGEVQSTRQCKLRDFVGLVLTVGKTRTHAADTRDSLWY